MTLVFQQFAKNIFNELYYVLIKSIRNSRRKKEGKVHAEPNKKEEKYSFFNSASVAAGL